MSRRETDSRSRPFRLSVTFAGEQPRGPRAAELAAPAAVHGPRVHISRTSASSRWNSPPLSQYKAAVLRSSKPAAAQNRVLLVLACTILVGTTGSGLAYAQAPSQPAPKGEASAKPGPGGPRSPSGSPPGSNGGKKVISLDDEFLVEGQLEKPSAFYVLRRSSTDYDWSRLDATMTPLVLESVWDPLF